jgi:hypothetical protein
MKEGIFILDISDKNNITEVNQFIPDIHYPIPNPNSIQTPNARGLTVKDDLLYVCYDAGGLRIIDISDKSNPVEIGRYINAVNNKQQAFNNIILNGDLAYVATDYCGMEIIDISNPNLPTRTAWLNPWGCETAQNNWFNSGGHVNQLAYDPQSNFIFLSSGRSEMLVVDVENPLHPKIKSIFGDVDNEEGVWGIDLKDDKVYLLYITSVVPYVSNFSGIRCIQWEEI